MYTIAYYKTTKKIMFSRHDYSTVMPFAFDFYFKNFCKQNKLNEDDYTVIEHTFDDNLNIVYGNHIFNEATQQIEADPSYVELAQQLDTPS
jgi:hypothetical protein